MEIQNQRGEKEKGIEPIKRKRGFRRNDLKKGERQKGKVI